MVEWLLRVTQGGKVLSTVGTIFDVTLRVTVILTCTVVLGDKVNQYVTHDYSRPLVIEFELGPDEVVVKPVARDRDKIRYRVRTWGGIPLQIEELPEEETDGEINR